MSTVTANSQVFVAEQTHQLQLLSIPNLEEGEVLVKITTSTICGSDVHTWLGHRSQEIPGILGHEAVGVIVDSRRSDFQVGQRVSWALIDSCNHCSQCEEYKQPQKCDHLFKYGHSGMGEKGGLNGTFSSHIILRAGTHILEIPSELEDELVAPANCALATMVNVVEKCPKGKVALVQGAGMLGIYAIALLREKGYEKVYCCDLSVERLKIAEEFTAIGVLPDQVPADLNADVVIEVAGHASVLPQGIDAVRIGGTYLLVGLVHPESELPFTAEKLIRKNLTLIGVHNYAPWHLDVAIAFLEKTREQYPFMSLVSPAYKLENLQEALYDAQAGKFLRISVAP